MTSSLPKPAEVQTALVQIDDGDLSLPERTLPIQDLFEILECLKPTYVDKSPDLWHVIGALKLIRKDATTFKILVYDGGPGPIHYSVNGIRCYRGGSSRRIKAVGPFADEARIFLRALQASCLAQNDSKMQERYLDLISRLRESSGR